MNTYIKQIALFKFVQNQAEDKRVVSLDRGLNIISGDSKTGKSALLSIVSWCLGGKFEIPKGEIEKFATDYAIILCIKDKNIVVNRKKKGSGQHSLFLREVDDDFSFKSEEAVWSDFFDAIIQKDYWKSLNQGLIEIEKELGYIDEKTSEPSIIPDALPFLFQPQDILPSRKELFVEMPKFDKLPILAGWYSKEYKNLVDTRNKLKEEVKAIEKKIKQNNSNRDKLTEGFKNDFKNLYALLGKKYQSEWTTDHLLEQLNNPSLFNIGNIEEEKLKNEGDSLFGNSLQGFYIQLSGIKEELKNKNNESTKLWEYRIKLQNMTKDIGKYQKNLEKQSEKMRLIEESILSEKNQCPVCNQEVSEISAQTKEINEAQAWLKRQLVDFDIREDKNDFNTIIKTTDSEIEKLKKEMAELGKEKDRIEKEISQINGLDNNKQYIIELQGKIKGQAEIIKKFSNTHIIEEEGKSLDDKYKSKETELQQLELRINQNYNIEDKRTSAQKKLNNEISRIINLLDYETKNAKMSYKISSGLNEYELHDITNDRETFTFSEIGSVSNFIACHLALSLGFLYFFATEKASKVPSILFIDQPSQAYQTKESEDVKKVANIYDTFLDTIEKIENDAGFTPQIIVMDHVKNLGHDTLGEKYFKADWTDGKALI